MKARKNVSRADKIQKYILANVQKHPQHIVTVVSEHFKVTRMTAHRHTQNLVLQGLLLKTGTTNNTSYSLPGSLKKYIEFKLSSGLSESEIWQVHFSKWQKELSENVYSICYYGLSEMLNNAIDHSDGKFLSVETEMVKGKLKIQVYDNGIGIFEKIKKALHLSDARESVLHLTKGKFTTAPQYHSGEGIFFSSRVFDSFAILSKGLSYIRNTKEDDWCLESFLDNKKIGTLIEMEIALNSKRTIQEVFKKYSDPETNAFNKTTILVNLSLLNEEQFVSRSQAKRILLGLEKFEQIVLDFKGIRSVGQAFVDEVFRVFKQLHPAIQIKWIHANSDVEFMITRGLATASPVE